MINNIPWWMHPIFRPVRLQNLVLWTNSASYHGGRWQNIAPIFTNTNHGTLHGTSRDSLIHPSGIFGSEIIFDGVSDYVDCGNDPSLNITDAITVEAWVKFNSLDDDQYIVRKRQSASWGIHLHYYQPSDLFNFYVETSDGIKTIEKSGHGFGDWDWHHVVGTYDKDGGTSNMNLYVDGSLFQTGTKTGSILTSSYDFIIGYTSSSFDGTIDEVRIYNRALSANEINQNYLHSVRYYIEKGIDPLNLLNKSSRNMARVVI